MSTDTGQRRLGPVPRGVYPAGSHVFNPAGSAHTVQSAEGCVALLIWRKPNTFLGDGHR